MSAYAVYRLELGRLRVQRRTVAALAGCALLPPAVLAGLSLGSGLPTDTLFGRQLHDSGFATPLFLLTVCSAWVLPLLSSLVAGDTVSGEHARGTWQLLLARVSRQQVFTGKALAAGTCTVVLVAVLAASSVLTGVLVEGRGALLDLSGATVPAGHAAGLALAAWATTLPPALAYSALALLLSVWSRSSAVGVTGTVVLGLLLQLAAQVVGGPGRALLLPTAFSGWHGLLLERPVLGPLLAGSALSAGWAAVCLLLARRAVLHDDGDDR